MTTPNDTLKCIIAAVAFDFLNGEIHEPTVDLQFFRLQTVSQENV